MIANKRVNLTRPTVAVASSTRSPRRLRAVRWAEPERGAATVAALSFALGVVALVVPIAVFLALPRNLGGGLLLGVFGPVLLIVMLVCALLSLALGILNRRAGASLQGWLPGIVVSSTALIAIGVALALLVYVAYS